MKFWEQPVRWSPPRTQRRDGNGRKEVRGEVSQRLREGSSQQSQLPQRAVGRCGVGLMYHLDRWCRVERTLSQSPESKTEETKTIPRHFAKELS